MKKFKSILIIIICIGILLGGFFLSKKFSIERKVETLSSKIEEQVVNLAELSAVKYNYTNIAEYDDKLQVSGLNLPFTKKAYLVKYSGYIKAGIDVEDLDIQVISPDLVEVLLPESKVLDNVISEEDVYFYNEKDSVFNRLKFDDLYDLFKEEKLKMEKEVIDKGILVDANKNLEKTIRSILQGIGVKNVKFK